MGDLRRVEQANTQLYIAKLQNKGPGSSAGPIFLLSAPFGEARDLFITNQAILTTARAPLPRE